MKRKLIQWPEAKYWDKPWNPIIGCRPCSPACEHCYAKRVVERFNTTGICAPGFAPTETGRVNPPRKGVVFCGNMTDLFGMWVQPPAFSRPGEYIERTLGNVGDATYLWCTKRPENMGRAISSLPTDADLSNQFFGFTAENQELYDHRIEARINNCERDDAYIWVSVEPILGPVNLHLYDYVVDWIVVGSESGPYRRPCKTEWVETVVEQCVAARVPVFVKQLDIGGKCVTDIDQFPEHLRIRQVPWKKEDAK